MNKQLLLRMGIFTAICSFSVGAADTVSINPAQEFQTIEGWGTTVKWDVGPQDSLDLGNAAFRTLVHDDLGLNVLRMWGPMDFESTNDNSDPNMLDRSKFNYKGDIRWIITMIRTMKPFGDMKFVISVLTPPAWMKDNNSLVNGGSLRPTMREEFAENLVAVYQTIKDSCGVELYSICIQNEPAFVEPYGSCVYTAPDFAAVTKVVGARFTKEGITMKFHGGDDMLGSPSYPRVMLMDTGVAKYLKAVSVHGYVDGIAPTPTSTASLAWGSIYNMARAKGLSTWMTETSGWQPNNALTAGMQVGVALLYGNASMWLYLAINGNQPSVYTLMGNRQYTGVGAAHKHFYRWIKTGAVRMGTTYVNKHLLLVAFRHKVNQTLTVVAVNDSSAPIQIQLKGANIPASMQKFSTRSPTAPVKLCQDDGAVQTGGAITIDGYNIVTLYGTGYSPPAVGVRDYGARINRPVSADEGSARRQLFTPGGRVLGRTAQMKTPGLVIVRDGNAGIAPVVIPNRSR